MSEGADAPAASRPILFLVDDEERVLEALERDLRPRFGAAFRIMGEGSARAALGTLAALADQGEEIALLMVDQRMPDLSGEELLARAHELHPHARRVLVVERDYTSTNPVVLAMTLGQVDYHFTKPWFAEGSLERAVSEFLAEWARGREPVTAPVRMVGREWHERSHAIRDLLTRFGIRYAWEPADSEAGRRLLEEAGETGERLPVLITYDGRTLVDPPGTEILAALGARTSNHLERCDLAIVGAGPAGLAGAVYAASEGLETLVLERDVAGGQAGTSSRIRNYPGFPHGIGGADFGDRACEQAWLFGADLVFAQPAVGLAVRGDDLVVGVGDGSEVAARAVIVATGVAWRRVGVPSLEALVGAGVFYGAAPSEARAMRGRDVTVVGAGNSAGQAAVELARHARSVTVLARGETLARSMSSYLVGQLEATANVTVRLRTEIVDAHAGERLEGLMLRDGGGRTERLATAALFVLIGAEPHTAWLPASIERDPGGFLLTGRDLVRSGAAPPGWPLSRPPGLLETSVPGVFAAGDVRAGSLKRVAAAVGDGATAVRLVHEHLAEVEERAGAVAGRAAR